MQIFNPAAFPLPTLEPSDTPDHYALKLACYCLRYVPEHGALITAEMSDDILARSVHGLMSASTLGWPHEGMVIHSLTRVLTFVRERYAARMKYRQELSTYADLLLSADSHPTGGKPVPLPASPAPLIPPARQPVDIAF